MITRHWFRFRLSTVLIVTAIMAWAMATPRTLTIDAGRSDQLERLSVCVVLGQLFVEEPPGSPIPCRSFLVVLNPVVIWPTLTLATFLAWKAAWAIVPQMVRRREPVAPESSGPKVRLY